MEDVSDNKLDLGGAKHDVWLVKVPKYLAKTWIEAPEGAPVGKLKITKYGRLHYCCSISAIKFKYNIVRLKYFAF